MTTPQTTPDLLPCPFCGHDKPSFERTGTGRHSCIVECGNCGARHESSDEYERSGESWNTRARVTAAPQEGVSRESQMVTLKRDATGTPTVWCDPEIADLIKALNDGGIPTIASCSGHGAGPGRISLKDGRDFLIFSSLEEANSAHLHLQQLAVECPKCKGVEWDRVEQERGVHPRDLPFNRCPCGHEWNLYPAISPQTLAPPPGYALVPLAADDEIALAVQTAIVREFGDHSRATLGYFKRIWRHAVEVAAALPPGRGMVPMTLREIADATTRQAHVRSDHVIEIVRAAEQFHGIKEGSATPLGDGEGAR